MYEWLWQVFLACWTGSTQFDHACIVCGGSAPCSYRQWPTLPVTLRWSCATACIVCWHMCCTQHSDLAATASHRSPEAPTAVVLEHW